MCRGLSAWTWMATCNSINTFKGRWNHIGVELFRHKWFSIHVVSITLPNSLHSTLTSHLLSIRVYRGLLLFLHSILTSRKLVREEAKEKSGKDRGRVFLTITSKECIGLIFESETKLCDYIFLYALRIVKIEALKITFGDMKQWKFSLCDFAM